MAKSRIRFPGLKYVPLVDLNSHIKYELPIEYRKTEEFGGKRDALPYSIHCVARTYLETIRILDSLTELFCLEKVFNMGLLQKSQLQS